MVLGFPGLKFPLIVDQCFGASPGVVQNTDYRFFFLEESGLLGSVGGREHLTNFALPLLKKDHARQIATSRAADVRDEIDAA